MESIAENSVEAAKGKIIGRVREQKILHELVASKQAEFIAVYGRRRVGKTYLIKNFARANPECLFFHVTGIQKGSAQEQLQEFARQIGVTFYPGATIAPQKNWMNAFQELTQAIDKVPKTKKIILFLDEFPWMATPRSKLLMALELYWNRYWVFDDRVKLIICGSATSWIIENIINNKGGLHNRVTRTLQLKPFSLHEVERYLIEYKKIHLTRKHILDLYIVLGGVPLYWSFIQKGLSAHECIDELCFQSDGPLVNEFKRLFSSLFEDSKPYVDLIRTIAKHRYGIGQSELIAKLDLPNGGNTIKRLHQLEEAGFILSLVPYGRTNKGVYYIVDDEYSLFYLYWIEPNMRTIAKRSANHGFWLSQSRRPSWKAWAGLAFESVCYKHIDQIRCALRIDPGAVAGTWRLRATKSHPEEEGAQIDLLFDRLDDAITLCEIKCSDGPFAITKDYAHELLRKMELFRKQTKTKKQLFLSLITTYGLKPTFYSEEIVSRDISLDALFTTLC